MDSRDLSNFTTTDDDAKKSVRKAPKEGKMIITIEMMEKGLDWIIKNKDDILSGKINDPNRNQMGINQGFN